MYFQAGGQQYLQLYAAQRIVLHCASRTAVFTEKFKYVLQVLKKPTDSLLYVIVVLEKISKYLNIRTLRDAS